MEKVKWYLYTNFFFFLSIFFFWVISGDELDAANNVEVLGTCGRAINVGLWVRVIGSSLSHTHIRIYRYIYAHTNTQFTMVFFILVYCISPSFTFFLPPPLSPFKNGRFLNARWENPQMMVMMQSGVVARREKSP